MKFTCYLQEVTQDEVKGFIDKWKTKLKKYGVTEFNLSDHFLIDRLNHKRNKPAIEVKELDSTLEGFLRKVGIQFKKDVENVKNHTAKRRGINKKDIPQNEFEFVVSSNSSNVNFVFVLKQDFHKKGTAVILPMTILRKKKFKANKGDHIVVECYEI